VDCVVGAWRGVTGACGIGENRVASWAHALRAAVATEVWRGELDRNGWAASYTEGAALHRFLEQERGEMAAALNELGLMRLDAPYSARKTTERST
jgi:putative tricarboxylic transport membrane protein